MFKNPALARTLRRLAEAGWRDFYAGEIAEAVARFSEATGGPLRRSDLAEHAPLWVEPIGVDYRGARVCELPPNGQGMAALLALKILGELDAASRRPDERLHLAVEAMKLAFATVADPAYAGDGERLLHEDRIRALAGRIGPEAVPWPEPAVRPGGTVYLSAMTPGLGVSFIQSNYMGFGAGLVVPGTGIALHNRGHNFTLTPGHPNVIAPGKRFYHTIIPGYLALSDGTHGPFGVIGSFTQPQGHLQVVQRLVDDGENPPSPR